MIYQIAFGIIGLKALILLITIICDVKKERNKWKDNQQ
jgi:uncharacterized membrane protein YuzA (DUF378 family)